MTEAADCSASLAARFESAWNRHDMVALGRLFHDDASFVNVAGRRMHGRAEIEQAHTTVHAGPYRRSQLVVDVDAAREIAPTVVIADLRTSLSGDERAPGEVRTSLLTLVVVKRGDEWLIAAAQNTFVLSPPPAP